MWITGNDAINRYDGNYVKVYNKDVYFDNCKNLQQGYGIVEDDKQNIYIGSTNGLYIYKRNKDKFNAVFLNPNTKDQTVFPIGFIDGKIWCHTKDFNIISYDIKSNTSKIFNTNNKQRVTSFHIYDNRESPIFTRLPFLDNDKNLWIINPNELLFFNTKTNKNQSYLENYLLKNKLKILSSSYDKFSDKIIIGLNDGLLIFDCKTKIFELKKNFNIVESVANNRDIIVVKNKKKFEIYTKDFQKVNYQSHGEIFFTSYGYSFDKMNRLWVCKDGFGQLILDFNPPFLNKVSSTNNFLAHGVSSFVEFPDGDMLIQNEEVFDRANREFKKIKIKDNNFVYIKNILDKENKVVWQIVQNTDETVELYKISKSNHQQLYHKFPKISPIGLFQDAVLINNMLLCSFQNGLFFIDFKNKILKKIKNQTKTNAFKINPISKNRIIVSYLNQEATVFLLNDKNEIVSSRDILTGYQPFYFEAHPSKNIFWTGTNNGILILDKNFEIIKKIDANNNLAGTYIYGILLDEKGNCWASHQRGLSFINAENYNIINFTKEDGIQDWDFNNRTYYKTSDGTLFFGGMKGFNYFKPPLKYDNKIYQSKVYIDEILINQNKISNIINNDFIKTLKLKHDENNISIHAIILNIYKGKQSPIIYRINKSKWIFKKSDCTIDLVNLASDNYKLELGVYDKFENKAIIQKTLLITVSSPFYQKIWFWIIISFIVSAFLFWSFNKQKFANQKRKFEQQLELEKQRSKITADLHDEIGSTLSSLQINSTVANKLMEKDIPSAQKVLKKVESQAKSLAEKIGDIIWSMKPGKDEFMTLSTRIKNYCNEVLGSTDINYSIEIDERIDALLTDFGDRKNVLLITKEALNNALKYSKASKIEVFILYENNTVLLRISDNGIGFNTIEVSGNGIGNMKNRSKELNASFQITSDENLGTTIQLQFKVVP